MIHDDTPNTAALFAQIRARYTALRDLDLPTYAIQCRATTDALYCLCCGLTSYNPQDVTNRYCNHCHLFHGEPAMNLANFHHHYETIQRMLLCERTAREKIIYQPDRAHKLAEIDAALLALTAIKEELYQHSQPSAAKPATLLHLPGRN